MQEIPLPLDSRVFHVHCTGTSFPGEINWHMTTSNNGPVAGPFQGDGRAASRLSNFSHR